MNKEAVVQVLTAEVRVLMVGSRQVTLSVFRQLDWVDWWDCEPFGRINDRDFNYVIIGKSTEGNLVRARIPSPPAWSTLDEQYLKNDWGGRDEKQRLQERRRQRLLWQTTWDPVILEHKDLPLIILAGLR
jgi:hypothetical protein